MAGKGGGGWFKYDGRRGTERTNAAWKHQTNMNPSIHHMRLAVLWQRWDPQMSHKKETGPPKKCRKKGKKDGGVVSTEVGK